MNAVKVGAVVALAIGLSGAAWAQNRTQQQSSGNVAFDASRSGGPGTHVGALRTGSVSSNEKVLNNQNGYSRDY